MIDKEIIQTKIKNIENYLKELEPILALPNRVCRRMRF